jgi:hypothetical protein
MIELDIFASLETRKPMTMPGPSPPVDLHFAEQFKPQLPAEFFDDLVFVEAELDSGAVPDVLVAKGSKSDSIPGIRAGILHELWRLLCTEDPFYKSVREGSRVVTQNAAFAIGAYLATITGLAATLLTGAVAYLALVIMKLGAGLFCSRYRATEVAP